MHAEHVFPPDLSAPRLARSWVAGELAPVGLPPRRLEDALLLVSELVTNVVVHTESAPTVALRVDGDSVVVGVADSDDRLAAIRESGALGTGGWGLKIVDEVADTWGSSDSERGGKVLWFTLDRDGPEAPAGGS